MNKKIAIAGTGYVGLSIATLLAQYNQVTAVDVIPDKVEMLNNRKSPIQDEYIEKRNEEIDRLNAKLSRAILLGNDYVKEQCLKDIQKIDSEISDHMQAQSA